MGRFFYLFCVTFFFFPYWVVAGVLYTVEEGDSLFKIAERAQIPFSILLRSHPDPHKSLKVGSKIFLPAFHMVEKGDTLYRLSRHYGIAVERLMEINRIEDPGQIRVGQGLLLETQQSPLEKGSGKSAVEKEEKPAERLTSSVSTTAGSEPRRNLPDPSEDVVAKDLLHAEKGSSQDKVANSVAKELVLEKKSARSSSSEKMVIWPVGGEKEKMLGPLKGVVITVPDHDVVRSVSQGRVAYLGRYRSFSDVVLVASEAGWIYGYAGMDHLDVHLGEEVTPGFVLGKVYKQNKVLFFTFQGEDPIDVEKAPRG